MISKKVFIYFYLVMFLTGVFFAVNYGYDMYDYYINETRYFGDEAKPIDNTTLHLGFSLIMTILMGYRLVITYNDIQEEKRKDVY